MKVSCSVTSCHASRTSVGGRATVKVNVTPVAAHGSAPYRRRQLPRALTNARCRSRRNRRPEVGVGGDDRRIGARQENQAADLLQCQRQLCRTGVLAARRGLKTLLPFKEKGIKRAPGGSRKPSQQLGHRRRPPIASSRHARFRRSPPAPVFLWKLGASLAVGPSDVPGALDDRRGRLIANLRIEETAVHVLGARVDQHGPTPRRGDRVARRPPGGKAVEIAEPSSKPSSSVSRIGTGRISMPASAEPSSTSAIPAALLSMPRS
jgi:hypothetical protein